ncbi:coenzyme F420-0:L-glutamate ligase [Oceanospirillum beijerinckii]|uniref:coenzyme F420-0:L-glutamate ligase n=1 Tax=Oceanospirillum beijerinckii TaxID=64976 RepID=UPI0004042273|nr:coenzyme F420-0:L-glutamate ligase [Oceanospirillum beijerinckii]
MTSSMQIASDIQATSDVQIADEIQMASGSQEANTVQKASSTNNEVSIVALDGIPDIYPGDDLNGLILEAIDKQQYRLDDGDIIVIAHKVVSKQEGQIIDLNEITPSEEALSLGKELNKDPRKVQVILSESNRLVRTSKRPDQEEGTIIAEHRLGFICANAAVDESNVDAEGKVILLPHDPDYSAREICRSLESATGKSLGVIITDTFGRPWRMGLVNVAVGLANVPGKVDLAGDTDAYGRVLSVTVPALADEIAAASGLLMSKNGKKPVLIFKGVDWQKTDSSARDLVRPQREDLFR